MNHLFSHLLRRGPVVCTRPPQSTQLANSIRNSIILGVALSEDTIAVLKDLIQQPGVLATPRDLQEWAEIGVLRGSPALRATLEGFALADTPIPRSVAIRLLASCPNLHASEKTVEYLARHLRKVSPATLTAPQCIATIRGLIACHYPQTDPLFATLVARIKEENAACDIRLLTVSKQCAALRPLFTPAFLACVVQDLRAGVYKPIKAVPMLLGLRFVVHYDIIGDLCNAIWRSHSGSMRPESMFKLIKAGGNLDEMRRSLSERSAEFLQVVTAKEIHHLVARKRWDVGALQTILEAALLPTVSRTDKSGLIEMLGGQLNLWRINNPLTDAVVEALGPQGIPLGLACTVLSHSGFNKNETALTHPRPFLDAVLVARSDAFLKLTCLGVLSNLVRTLVSIRSRGSPEAPVGDALAATAALMATTSRPLQFKGAMRVACLLSLKRHLTPSERRTLWGSVLTPMYRHILKGLPTAFVGMVAVAFMLAPPRDRGHIGKRLVAITGDSAEAFRGLSTYHVISVARRALLLRSSVDVAHIIRHFTHWCRTRDRLSPTHSVANLRVLTMASRVSPPVLRKMFIDVRSIVTLLDSRDVTRVLVAMARCHCVDLALIDCLLVRALVIAPSWQDNDIAPAILAMAHLRVVCLLVLKSLVRRLQTLPVGVQRRHAPKVVEALAALIA